MKRQMKTLNKNQEINSIQFFKDSNPGFINFDLMRSKLNKKKSPKYHTIFNGVNPDGRKLRIPVI
jgi:hypothetical protein